MSVSTIKMILGHAKRNRLSTLINLSGMAIGLAAFWLIVLFLQYETTYDLYHPNLDRLRRIYVEAKIGQMDELRVPVSSVPIRPALLNETDGIEEVVRIKIIEREESVSYNNVTYLLSNVCWADSSLFQVLGYHLQRGEESSALHAPQLAIISGGTAQLFFGDENPIGEEIVLNNEHSYTVSGVLAPSEGHSHLPDFPVICSFASLAVDDNSQFLANNQYYCYALLEEGVTVESLSSALETMVERRDGETLRNVGGYYHIRMQPIQEAYLDNNFQFNILPTGSRATVTQFTAIAVFILLLSCLNFINITTALSARYAKQVGICKSVGATRFQLVRQLLSESVLISVIAAILSLILVFLLLPSFSQLSGKPLEQALTENIHYLPFVLLFAVIIGLIAGIYPSFLISGFKPVDVLKGQLGSGKRGNRLRTTFVIFQFIVSIVLIISSLIVWQQMRYVRNVNPGFDDEHLLILHLNNDIMREQWQAFQAELDEIPGVVSNASTVHIPTISMSDETFHRTDAEEDADIWMHSMNVGYNFFETMDMEVVQGRNFSEEIVTDSETAIIINEAAARRLGWEDPIGMTLGSFTSMEGNEWNELTVIGVIKDFHFQSLHTQIEPTVIHLQSSPDMIIVRLHPDDIVNSMQAIENLWTRFSNGALFHYQFLDDTFDNLYQREVRMGTLLVYFTVIAVFVAGLGLFALASFSAQARKQEIGIRKVMGASTTGLIFLLSGEFIRPVIIANIVAWPIALLLMNRWLENFAYHTSVDIFTILITAAGSLAIALVTSGGQAMRAAHVNPVQTLRSE